LFVLGENGTFLNGTFSSHEHKFWSEINIRRLMKTECETYNKDGMNI
jgi:hypothetical protein